MYKNYKFIFLAASFFALLDQFSKYLVEKYLQSPYPIFGNFFELEYSQNTGIAFGLPIPQIILIPVAFILMIFIFFFAKKELNLEKNISKTAIALILGGALGNLIDRLVYGYVIDFIAVWEWPNFNLADIYISVGVLLILVFYGRIRRT